MHPGMKRWTDRIPHCLLVWLPAGTVTFCVALFGTRWALGRGMLGSDTLSQFAIANLMAALGVSVMAQFVAVPWGIAVIVANPRLRTWRNTLAVVTGLAYAMVIAYLTLFTPAFHDG
jgi:hypothetical protein